MWYGAYSKELAAAINGFLTEDGWSFRFDEENGRFAFSLALEGKMRVLEFYLCIAAEGYTVYAFPPFGADVKDARTMAALQSFLCMANHALLGGNFDLDLRDGELRFKYSVDCSGGAVPNRAIIRNSIFSVGAMFQYYLPGFIAILFRGAGAEEAITECEKYDGGEERAQKADSPVA